MNMKFSEFLGVYEIQVLKLMYRKIIIVESIAKHLVVEKRNILLI